LQSISQCDIFYLMKKLKTRHFSRWARKSGIADEQLFTAAKELEIGLFAAALGGFLYKVRLAGQSSGKSSGYRTIIAYRKGDRLLFLYGFAKNERDNIDSNELEALKKLSKDYLSLSLSELERAIKMGILTELE
jgi:hypothetical protein